MPKKEKHVANRIGWLRAAVLGANDGIVSIASLVVGVAAASSTRADVLLAGIAALVAGAMSMAAGEYVSVSSQADTEEADLAREKEELEVNEKGELKELTDIYVKRGLKPTLAKQVATQLMENDALKAHARDELGLTEIHTARPFQAAWTSALSFALGAALPLLAIVFSPEDFIIPIVVITSLLVLGSLGALAASIGGANLWKGAFRVTFWGLVAMIATFLVGRLFGATVV
jgi:vacuolar iron transporter family protein